MNYKQLQNTVYNKLAGSDVNRQVLCYGHLIAEMADGRVLVDQAETLFSSLEEAQEKYTQLKLQEDIQKEIQSELYEEMSDTKIADIIRKHHDVRVTDTLIESYVELASSKLFTSDPVAQDIRKLQKLDRLIEGRLDYVLDDGSVVIITEEAQQRINNIFGRHEDVIQYMRQNKENFLGVLHQVEE